MGTVGTECSPKPFKVLQSSMLFALLFCIFLWTSLSTAAGCPATTAADSWHAFHRCQNESTATEILKLLWRSWEFPDEQQTHCYVMCFLRKLGLINLTHRGLEGEKISNRLSKLELEVPIWSVKWLNEPLDGTCVSYYKVWIQLKKILKKQLPILFYPDESNYVETYDSSDVNDCCYSDLRYPSKAERKHTQYKCKLKCLFKQIHFLDAYGRVDSKEIAQSLVNVSRIEIDKCAHRANQLFSLGLCEVVLQLHKCLEGFNPVYENSFVYLRTVRFHSVN